MKAILLNGPPRSGKDYAAEHLIRWLGGVTSKFALPIVQYMWLVHGIDMSRIPKDTPHPVLFGKTPRQVAIVYSEQMCRPVFGKDYFGKRAVREIEIAKAQRQELVIFSDSGFREEADCVIRHLGEPNVLVVRLSRPGTTFEGDSRSYWDIPENVGCALFENNQQGTTKLHDELLMEIERWRAS